MQEIVVDSQQAFDMIDVSFDGVMFPIRAAKAVLAGHHGANFVYMVRAVIGHGP